MGEDANNAPENNVPENSVPENSEKKDGYVKRMTNPSQRLKRASAGKREKNPVLFVILIIGLVALAGILIFLFFK